MWRNEILARVANLQAELAALTSLVGGTPSVAERAPSGVAPAPVSGPAPRGAVSAPTPKASAKASPAKVKPPRWSYRPGTTYRIVGANPFREGNLGRLFDRLAADHGDRPFSVEQIFEAIRAQTAAGAFVSTATELANTITMLSFAGIQKGRVELVGVPPRGGSAS